MARSGDAARCGAWAWVTTACDRSSQIGTCGGGHGAVTVSSQLAEEVRVSRREVVDAYGEGRISRRVFAKRLVATGVSAGAAASYAAALAPTASASGRETCLSDFYEDFYEAQVRFSREQDPKRFAKDVRKATKNLVKCLRKDDD
jgi:hypothetical protein